MFTGFWGDYELRSAWDVAEGEKASFELTSYRNFDLDTGQLRSGTIIAADIHTRLMDSTGIIFSRMETVDRVVAEMSRNNGQALMTVRVYQKDQGKDVLIEETIWRPYESDLRLVQIVHIKGRSERSIAIDHELAKAYKIAAGQSVDMDLTDYDRLNGAAFRIGFPVLGGLLIINEGLISLAPLKERVSPFSSERSKLRLLENLRFPRATKR